MQWKVIIRASWFQFSIFAGYQKSSFQGKWQPSQRLLFCHWKWRIQPAILESSRSTKSGFSFYFTSLIVVTYRAESHTCLQSIIENKRQLCLVTKASSKGVRVNYQYWGVGNKTFFTRSQCQFLKIWRGKHGGKVRWPSVGATRVA